MASGDAEIGSAGGLQAAREAWPDIPEPTGFAGFVEARLEPANATPAYADLYLACACLQGDATANARLEEMLRTASSPALARLRMDAADVDDLLQDVLAKLVLGPQPKLAGYRGRGPLKRWLRSFALRTGLKRTQRSRPTEDVELLDALPTVANAPEDALSSMRFRTVVRTALAKGFQTLTPRERTLIRQHYLDGLTLAQVGSLHRVSRRTAARWLAAAREQLERATRTIAVSDAGLTAGEFQRMLPFVWSQLRSGLGTLLSSDAEPLETDR